MIDFLKVSEKDALNSLIADKKEIFVNEEKYMYSGEIDEQGKACG